MDTAIRQGADDNHEGDQIKTIVSKQQPHLLKSIIINAVKHYNKL